MQNWSYFWYGVFGGLIGGAVGFFTWFLFHIKGKTSNLTAVVLVGYVFAFTFIAGISPLITGLIVIVMDD